jgi:P27 family predicted phage terminase small subunit
VRLPRAIGLASVHILGSGAPDLTALAAEEWRRLAPELHRLGLLTGVDITTFAAYCQSFATWCDATEVADGRTPDERRVLAGIARDAARDMVRYARAFGMTPSSRSAVSATDQQQGSKFDGLLPA